MRRRSGGDRRGAVHREIRGCCAAKGHARSSREVRARERDAGAARRAAHGG